jgi:DNA-binding transcriptional LysR family regulator
MMIELRFIRHALALAQHGNFARAAESLCITQPSLSRSIATLERALEVPLFDRRPRCVTPTPFGRVLLELGANLLSREAELRREIRLLAGLEKGSLTVGAGPYASEISVVNAHPRLKIQFTTADPAESVRDVLAERIDVGVAATSGASDDQRLVVETLPSHPIVLACRPGHPLATERQPSLARVHAFPLVTTLLRGAAAAASRLGEEGASGGDDADFVPPIAVNSLTLARLIARDSDALFPATLGMIADDLAAGLLSRVDFSAPAMRTEYGVIYLAGRTQAPAVRVFIETLHAVEAEAQQADSQPPARFPLPPLSAARSASTGAHPPP